MIALIVAAVAAIIILAMHLSHKSYLEFAKKEALNALSLCSIESYARGWEDGMEDERDNQKYAIEKILSAHVSVVS